MKPINLDNVQESGNNFKRLPAGGYIVKILKVTDNADKEYLTVEYDIADGEFKNYYTQLQSAKNFANWPARYIRSYKESAQGMFKHFLSTVDKCNGTTYLEQTKKGLSEASLAGRFIGLVLGEEEYISNQGEVRTRLYVKSEYTTEEIKAGKYVVPDLKKADVPAPAPKVTGNETWMQVPESSLPDGWV